jgi:hypothetical protein
MLVFYKLEDRSPWFILAFASACDLGSAYGFLQGAWPFGLVEAIWAGVAVRRWRAKKHASPAYLSLFPGAAEPLVTTSGFGHVERQHFAPIACP